MFATPDHMWFGANTDQVSFLGIGEWLIAMNDVPNLHINPVLEARYERAVRMVAQRGWTYGQHMINHNQQTVHLDVWERVNDDFPIAELRWMLAHGYHISEENIMRAKALGVGIGAHSTPYHAGTRPAGSPGNPPFRTIIDSGIPVGGGSDASRLGVMNPWLNIYYMITGKNKGGELINADQTITREEAIRLWTRNQGWFTFEEGRLGLLAPGSFADIVVLTDDIFDSARVSDDDIREVESVLTIVGGRIIHDTGVVEEAEPGRRYRGAGRGDGGGCNAGMGAGMLALITVLWIGLRARVKK